MAWTLEPFKTKVPTCTDLDEAQLPRHVLFFCEDEVAVTGNAKIKAGALRELAAKRLAGN